MSAFEVLGVDPANHTPDDIKKAYRRLAMRHHPDRNPGDEENANKFREVRAAYEELTGKTGQRSPLEKQTDLATGIICEYLRGVIFEFLRQGNLPEHQKVLESITLSINKEKEGKKEEKRNLEKHYKSIKRLVKRFKRKGDVNNPINDFLLVEVTRLDALKQQLTERMALLDIARKEVEQYSFEMIPPPPSSMSPMNAGSMFSLDPGTWFTHNTRPSPKTKGGDTDQ